MRKIFSNGLVMFAGIVTVPATVTHTDKQLAAKHQTDPRLEALRKFFQQNNCPAQELAHVFLHEADAHQLDWRLLPSISFVESTGGKAARNNNLFGWDSGRAEFSSYSEGIHTVAFHLSNSKLYKHKTVGEILAVYNPDPSYGVKVKSLMRRIAPSSENP